MSTRWRCHVLFGWLNFALAVPSIYLLLGLPLAMREQGWSGTEIGLFQLAGLPAVGKFLLALPVERFRFAGSHYKPWAVLLCTLLAVLLVLIGRQDMLASRVPLFLLALLASVLATWADIPLNALAIKLLPEDERIRAGSIRSAALFFGAIVGAGVMLLIHGRWGWQAPFLLMAAFLLLGVLPLARLGESPVARGSAQAPAPGLWRGYFAQPGAWAWTCLLLCCFPFIGASWLYLKPLLLDQGLPAQQVAWLAGVGGGVLGALSSVAVARLIPRLGVSRAIALFSGFAVFAQAGLTVAVWTATGPLGLLLGAALLACAMGAISALLFGLMMFFTRELRQATDYGLQASLFVLSRLLVPVAAGMLLDRFGYAGMLLGLTLAMLGVLALAMSNRRTIAEVAESSAERVPQVAARGVGRVQAEQGMPEAISAGKGVWPV